MLKNTASQILKNNESVYSLVIAVAKRAREIAEEVQLMPDKRNVIEKPVMIAVREFADGDCRLVEAENIGQEIEE